MHVTGVDLDQLAFFDGFGSVTDGEQQLAQRGARCYFVSFVVTGSNDARMRGQLEDVELLLGEVQVVGRILRHTTQTGTGRSQYVFVDEPLSVLAIFLSVRNDTNSIVFQHLVVGQSPVQRLTIVGNGVFLQQRVQQATGNGGYLGANGDTDVVGFNGDGRIQGFSELGLGFQCTNVQRPGQTQVLVQILVGVVFLTDFGVPGITAVVQGQRAVVGNGHVVGEFRTAGFGGHAVVEADRVLGGSQNSGTSYGSSATEHFTTSNACVLASLLFGQGGERGIAAEGFACCNAFPHFTHVVVLGACQGTALVDQILKNRDTRFLNHLVTSWSK